jgi:hypothetical protein
VESGARQRTNHDRSKRLAWALLASLLAHLVLIGDIARLHLWQPGIATARNPPLEVQLVSRVDEPASPAVIEPAIARRQPPRQFAVEAESPSASPNPESVVLADPATVQQDEQPAAPGENPATQIPGEQQEEDGATSRLPPSGKLVYQFYWGKSRWLAGLATHQWKIDNGYYTLSSNVSTTGLFALLRPTRLVEVSQGSLSGARLRPQMFTTQLNEFPPAISYFNWNKGYFRWHRGDASFTQPLPANAYDKISFLYQLYIASDRESLYSADITTGRRLEHYEIRNLGVDEIEIDGKIHPATHLKRAVSSADLAQVEIWLSTTDNLPIKMIYSNNAGDHFEQLITAESIALGWDPQN